MRTKNNKHKSRRRTRKFIKKNKLKQIGGGDSLYTSANYLEGVMFTPSNIGESIVNKSFNGDATIWFNDAYKKISEILPSNIKSTCGLIGPKWMNCKDKCYTEISKLVKHEIESTAYIIRAISNSLLTINPESKIWFNVTNVKYLTGIWESDKDKIDITIGTEPPVVGERLNSVPIVDALGPNPIKSRLIMGFGPSASGKTYWAKSIIEILSGMENSFPKDFITIDGGVYRESSAIYQTVIIIVKKTNDSGVKNLVSAGVSLLYSVTLFNSDIIKKTITTYLQLQSNKIPISLYVPETLGSCGYGGLINCYAKYKKFIDITKDESSWIGLLIWQHKTGLECNYIDEYKCVGCTESGKQREKKEGKKYSNSAWEHSYNQGLKEMMKAPGYKYNIHNSGGKLMPDKETSCKSMIIYYKDNDLIPTYIPAIEQKYNCTFTIQEFNERNRRFINSHTNESVSNNFSLVKNPMHQFVNARNSNIIV